jgi:hypothetical protein
MRRLRLNASAVGVDRGRWRLTDRGHEGAVAPGDRSVARHSEASVGDADFTRVLARLDPHEQFVIQWKCD